MIGPPGADKTIVAHHVHASLSLFEGGGEEIGSLLKAVSLEVPIRLKTVNKIPEIEQIREWIKRSKILW
jgi:hypothetical protein